MLLADSAQEVGGKLYILGGGWSITGPEPLPMAIALKLEVPWDRTNEQHSLLLEFLDEDGEPGAWSTGRGRRAGAAPGHRPVRGRPPARHQAGDADRQRPRRQLRARCRSTPAGATSGACRSTARRTRTGRSGSLRGRPDRSALSTGSDAGARTTGESPARSTLERRPRPAARVTRPAACASCATQKRPMQSVEQPGSMHVADHRHLTLLARSPAKSKP